MHELTKACHENVTHAEMLGTIVGEVDKQEIKSATKGVRRREGRMPLRGLVPQALGSYLRLLLVLLL